MSKSKARKLAEFLRNLNDNSKLDTTGFADNRFVTSRTSLESNKTSDNTFVTNKAVTEYVDDAIADFVVDTTDFTLTFDGHMTGTATVTDFGNTTISLAAHSSLGTNNITEHADYPYFTNARARGAISVSGSLSYNSTTGVISYTQPTNISTFTNDSSYITNATASLDASKITGGTLNTARIPHPVNGDWWNNGYVRVQTDGVMEVGKYLDFHTADSGGGTDYDVRVTASSGAIDIDGDLTVDDITSGAITSSSTIRANDWFRGASNTNTLYSDNSNGTIIQTPSNTNDNAGMFRIRDGQGVVHFSLNTNTNVASFHGGSIASGSLASTITATTQSASDNSTKVATTAYVDSAVSGIVDSAPGTLNTLNELAAALGDDANFSTTVTNSIATKLPKAGGTMTGTIDSHVGDTGVILKSGNSSATGTPDQFKINHNLGNVEIRNSRGSINFPNVVNFTNINDINVNGTLNLGSSATANHFTGHYYHNRYSNGNVYVHYYPQGNTTNSNTYLRMPNGASFRALAFEGANMEWPGTFSIGTVNSTGSYTVPNSSQNGLKSANGNNFFYPLDQYNNMHIRSTTGSEYHDSTAYYFRRVNQTEIFRITTNGVDIRSGTLAINGTTVINASRDVTNVASVYASANIGNIDTTNGIGQQMEKGDASVTTLRFDSNRYRIYAGQSAGEMITALETGNVGIGDTNPSEKLTVNGNFQHKGLEMSSGTGVDQLYTASQTLTITTSYQDTGINGSELPTGTYIVQLTCNDHSVGGAYSMMYSGVMSWYGGNTNDVTHDEIVLHRTGHASVEDNLYLRTRQTASADTDDLKLQIKGNYSASGSSTYTFKFRRMI